MHLRASNLCTSELLGLGEALELLQRLVLDLADTLARDVNVRPTSSTWRMLAAQA